MIERAVYTPVRPTSRHKRISYGFSGTVDTVDAIRTLVGKWSVHPGIRDLAEWVVLSAPEHNTRAQAENIFWWVKNNVVYRRDPASAELLRAPDALLEAIIRHGKASADCDCYVIFLGSLLESVGIQCRAKTVGFTPEEGSYQHIFIEASVSNGFGMPEYWLPLDPTFPGAIPGRTVPVPGGYQREYVFEFGEPVHVPVVAPLLIVAGMYLLWRSW